MHQRRVRQLEPARLVVERLGGLQRDLNVAALESEGESGLVVLDVVQGHLRVALLLQVGYDRLADQARVADHVQHLLVLVVDQRELELELGRVDGEHVRPALAVQAEHLAALHFGYVDGQVQCADDTVISAKVPPPQVVSCLHCSSVSELFFYLKLWAAFCLYALHAYPH